MRGLLNDPFVSVLSLAFIFCSTVGVSARGERADVEMSYREDQAAAGRGLYADQCASCHGMMLEGGSSLPLTGATFQARWADGNHSVGDLYYIVRTLMPYGKPASLSRQEYLDIIAYLLMMNGYPAGDQALPLGSAALDSITINPRRP